MSTTLPRIAATLLTAALALPACSGGSRSAYDPCPCEGTAVCCESGVCAAEQGSCAAATAALSSSVRGTWTGYIENFQWASDDSIRISIEIGQDGTLSGWASIGQATPPAPATDPSLSWPVDQASNDVVR